MDTKTNRSEYSPFLTYKQIPELPFRIWTPPVKQTVFCYRYQTRMYIRLFVESLTPSPLCMRTPVPIWVDGL